VSLAPSATEQLFAVGAGERVVGVTTYCNFPPEAVGLPTIGGFAARTISLEKVAALQPDLVVSTGRLQQPLIEPLERLGLTVLVLDAATLDQVADNLRLLAQATDTAATGEQAAERLQRRIASVREQVAERPRPRVLYVLSEQPLMTVSPKTFIGQLIELAGGDNIFADAEQQYPRVSDEEVVRRRPEVLVVPAREGVSEWPSRLSQRPAWQELPAVRAGRLVTLDENIASRAGPRLADALEALAAALGEP
jgi:iron complex transport system substrate-binding protein